ncbi:uncharacterized protein LOC126905914 [Daktulosphaira vitifoliae]|uniref:uncharacterized protein LOC126905914 n=1 Tax=Daktulosphaira vitifoliae TaxID=58002 RepID=UPI0021A9A957|nr:uncharacterized protein LOC126905914 [Daktulosphaira vitifoliae]
MNYIMRLLSLKKMKFIILQLVGTFLVLRTVADEKEISIVDIKEEEIKFMKFLDSIGINDSELTIALGNNYNTLIENELLTLGSQLLKGDKKMDDVATEMTKFILNNLSKLYKVGERFNNDVKKHSTIFFTNVSSKFKSKSESKILRTVADKEEISKEGIQEDKTTFMNSLINDIGITDNELRSVLGNNYNTLIENELLTLGSQLLKGDKKMDDVVTEMTNFILKDLAVLYVWYNVDQPLYKNVKECSTTFFTSIRTKFKSKPKWKILNCFLPICAKKQSVEEVQDNWPSFIIHRP